MPVAARWGDARRLPTSFGYPHLVKMSSGLSAPVAAPVMAATMIRHS